MSIKSILIVLLSLTSAFLLYDDLSLRAEKHLLTQELLKHEMQLRRGEKRGHRHGIQADTSSTAPSKESRSSVERPLASSDSPNQSTAPKGRHVGNEDDHVNSEIEARAEARAHEIVDEWRAKKMAPK